MLRFEHAIQSINVGLRVAFFGLMCVGLGLSSLFLYFDMISGDNWVMVCSILFGADRIGHAISDGISSRRATMTRQGDTDL